MLLLHQSVEECPNPAIERNRICFDINRCNFSTCRSISLATCIISSKLGVIRPERPSISAWIDMYYQMNQTWNGFAKNRHLWSPLFFLRNLCFVNVSKNFQPFPLPHFVEWFHRAPSLPSPPPCVFQYIQVHPHVGEKNKSDLHFKMLNKRAT